MIAVTIYRQQSVCVGFQCKGHAGFADHGEDIVCAGVTTAVQMTINGITEVVGCAADVNVLENEITCRVTNPQGAVSVLLDSFILQIELLQEDYETHIEMMNLEV